MSPGELNREIFARLAESLDLPVQSLRLSLARVFEDREFEVLSFEGVPVASLGDLRSPDFYGFYLSHVDAENLDLVYACDGHHVEFGPRKCVLQSALESEPTEFPEPGLLGLAQDAEDNFVFVVTPRYRQWLGLQARSFTGVHARFLTAADLDARPALRWIWPEPPVT